MRLEINKNDTIPIYKQIVIQFENLIKDGKCKAGEKLPTEKELCNENDVSMGTIKKAFGELETNPKLHEKFITESIGEIW